jgi:hypothetical protein
MLRSAILALSLALGLLACAGVRAQPLVVAHPPVSTPNAELSARGVPGGAATDVFLSVRSVGGPPLRQAGPLATDAEGVVAAVLQLGALAPGEYVLALSQGTAGGAPRAQATFTIAPPLAVTVGATTARPGDTVPLTIAGLVPGTLQVTLGSAVLAGPLNTAGGTLQLPVVMPDSLPIGTTSSILVRNRENDLVLQAGGGVIRGEAPAFIGPARIVNLSGLRATEPVGGPITLNGTLQLAKGSPAGLRARLRATFPNGRSVLLDDGSAVVQANGTFLIKAVVPSLANGAPLHMPISGDATLDIVFGEPDILDPTQPRRGLFDIRVGVQRYTDDLPEPRTIRIQVRGPGNVPVPDVVVGFDGDDTVGNLADVLSPDAPAQPVQGSEPGTLVNSTALALGASVQTAHALAGAAPQVAQQISGQCPPSLFRGVTDANGNIDVGVTEFAYLIAKTEGLNATIAQGSPNKPVQTRTLLSINPLPGEHTFGTVPSKPQISQNRLTFRWATNDWCIEIDDTCVSMGSSPVLTYQVIPYTGSVQLPIVADIGGLEVQELEVERDTYGPLQTLPGNTFQDVVVQGSPDLPVRFTVDQNLFGIVSRAQLFRLGGGAPELVGNFPTNPGTACIVGESEETFETIIPNAMRMPWGLNRYRIEVERLGGSAFTRYDFDIKAIEPPVWFRNPPENTVRRGVGWSPGEPVFTVRVEPDDDACADAGGCAVSATPDPNYDIGTMDNANASGETLIGARTQDGGESLNRQVDNETEAVSQGTDDTSQDFGGIEASFQYEEDGPATILDTGTIPVFRYSWGIEPIVAATFGVDARFWVLLLLKAEASLDFNGLYTRLAAEPSVGGLIEAFINVSALLGLIDLQAAFTPSFGVRIPIVLVNGEISTAPQDLPCFNFDMDVSYEVSVGICDLCVQAGDEFQIFQVREPTGCTTAPPPPPSAAAGAKVTLGSLGIDRFAPPSVSFDVLGQGSMVRVADNGAIEVRRWQAGQFGPAVSLGSPPVGASQPAHVHYAVNRSVMVYEKSNLSVAAFTGSTIEQAVASRSLVYRVSNGGLWGAEQPLTAPGSGGEGHVSLAACPAGRPGCPATGEVLAVWMRHVGSGAYSFRYEVWHAYFRNNAWTAPARLADPGAGADMHPKAAYLGGKPIVTFTRSAARNIASQGTRMLMYVVLPDGTPAAVTGAPAGIIWQALDGDTQGRAVLAFTVATDPGAVIGDQTALWAARGTCPGTVCTFSVAEQRDALGRRIRAESPALEAMGDGSVRVAYRGLGYGPNAQGIRFAPGDTAGLVFGTGEWMNLEARFTPGSVQPAALSSDGAIYMNPTLALNPATGALVGFADQATQPLLDLADLRKRVPFRLATTGLKSVPVSGSLVQLTLPDAPDFVVEEVLPVSQVLTPAGTLAVDAVVRNLGRVWVYDNRNSLRIDATWEGGAGVGAPGATTQLTSLPPDGAAVVRLDVAVPAGYRVDDVRSLHVTVNAGGGVREQDASNNVRVANIGALPAPRNLRIVERRGDRFVRIDWPASTDPRVVAHRVWRARPPVGNARVEWFPVGMTYTNAFLDQTGDPGQRHWYRVTAVSAGGRESLPSRHAIAARRPAGNDVLFRSSLEAARNIGNGLPGID